jgi:hypothetical protein
MSRHRKTTRRRFLPTGLDALEDRALLSTVPASVRSLAAARLRGSRPGASQGGQSQSGAAGQPGQGSTAQQPNLVNQVLVGVDQQFGQFATGFFALEARYFNSLGDDPGPDSLDLDGFRSEVGTLASNLSQNVGNILNNVPGGSGVLGSFVAARLGSDMSASLKGQLTGLEGVGTNGLTTAGFAFAAQNAIGSALTSTENMVRLYDESLAYAAYGFLSGAFRFLPPSTSGDTSTTTTTTTGGSAQQSTGTANLTPAETVLGSIFRYFGNFSEDFRDARSQYYAGGDIAAFRDRVGRLVQDLETDTLNAVNAVPGGAGPLTRYLDARIDSTLTGSLSGTLLTLPDYQDGPLGQEGFTLASDTALLNTQLAVQNFVRLYDSSLAFVANGFYQQYFGGSKAGVGSGPLTSPGATNGGSAFTPSDGAGSRAGAGGSGAGRVSAMSAGRPGTVHAMAAFGYYSDPYGMTGLAGLAGLDYPANANAGVYSSYGFNTGFGGFPSTYDPNNGYGGLGGGFDFGPSTLYGGNLNGLYNVSNNVTMGPSSAFTNYSYGVSPFGTGVGFDSSNRFLYGYGTGIGVGPYANTAMTSDANIPQTAGTFAVVGPGFGSAYGGGYGAGAGFGGFYF